jgi:integrase
MPRRKSQPSYRLHKQSGQAIVTLPDGTGGRRDVLLGVYGSDESWTEYDRVIAEWRAAGKRIPVSVIGPPSSSDLTVNELSLAYLRHVEAYYVKDGKPTSEQATIKHMIRFVRRLYGDDIAKEFGPLKLKAVRQDMIDHQVVRRFKVVDPATGEKVWQERPERKGLARRFINKQMERVRRMFSWAVEEELVPAAVHAALAHVKGLAKGRGKGREKPRIRPAPEKDVEAVKPIVPPTVRAMIEVQQLSGCRPQDVVTMRGDRIDRTGPVWEYRPEHYKTEHHNDDDSPDRERIVYLGPKAQTILKPFLDAAGDGYLFSPRRSEEARNAQKKENRKTPRWPSHQRMQQKRHAARKRAPIRDRYDVGSYRRAIRRACKAAGVRIWSPLQLRHSAGTAIRACHGIEASQAVLGHAELGVTQVYAEVDRETARRVMAEMG